MAGKNEDFSQSDLAKIMSKPETKALLSRLRQLDSSALQEAVQQAMKGNAAAAQELLTPMMQDQQVQDLAAQMRNQYGGI